MCIVTRKIGTFKATTIYCKLFKVESFMVAVIRWKTFVVGWQSCKAYCTGYLTRKVSRFRSIHVYLTLLGYIQTLVAKIQRECRYVSEISKMSRHIDFLLETQCLWLKHNQSLSINSRIARACDVQVICHHLLIPYTVNRLRWKVSWFHLADKKTKKLSKLMMLHYYTKHS